MKWRVVVRGLLAAALAISAAGCQTVDDDRIPWADVRISFPSVGEWNLYGVSGAMTHKRFIKQDRVPANFPYTALTFTGFGGVLLVSDAMGVPQAYDLACPVEVRYNVRVAINQNLEAECPVCHSRYDVFLNYGAPLSGEAAEKGYGLTRYRVGPGMAGEYMVVSH